MCNLYKTHLKNFRQPVCESRWRLNSVELSKFRHEYLKYKKKIFRKLCSFSHPGWKNMFAMPCSYRDHACRSSYLPYFLKKNLFFRKKFSNSCCSFLLYGTLDLDWKYSSKIPSQKNWTQKSPKKLRFFFYDNKISSFNLTIVSI